MGGREGENGWKTGRNWVRKWVEGRVNEQAAKVSPVIDDVYMLQFDFTSRTNQSKYRSHQDTQ